MEFHSQIIQYRELTLIYDQVHTGLPLKYWTVPWLLQPQLRRKFKLWHII